MSDFNIELLLDLKRGREREGKRKSNRGREGGREDERVTRCTDSMQKIC